MAFFPSLYFFGQRGSGLEEDEQELLAKREFDGKVAVGVQAAIPANMNLGTLIESHRKLTEHWKRSIAFDICCNLFNGVILKKEEFRIISAICLGLGSIGQDEAYFDGHAMTQLVVFETWLELLGKELPALICFIQGDPFKSVEARFWEALPPRSQLHRSRSRVS